LEILEKLKYHTILSNYYSAQPLFFDGDLQKKPHIRKCVEQPFQQTKAQLWDEVTNTLCNLDFIQAKAAGKLTYDLVKDFNDVLEVITDNIENIGQEKAKQARMEKYTKDLIAYAKGEIKELEIPETLPLRTEQEINTEIERIKTNPTRLDHLKDFMNFLGNEASNLQNYAHEFPHFAIQEAWNYSDSGPVGENAMKAPVGNIKNLFLRGSTTRPGWDPIPQVILTLKGHAANVRAVAITPDCKKGISVSGKTVLGINDKMCILWDLKTGQSIHVLNGHNRQVNSVAITPDGKFAITGSADEKCIFWDLTDGKIIHTLKGHTNIVTSVAITPDGKKAISGSMDKMCIIWDLETGEAIKILHDHSNEIGAVAITPDGKKAVSSETKSIYFPPVEFTCITWDLITGRTIHILKNLNSQIMALSITPDGRRAILGSSDKTCIIWDLISGNVVNILKGHSGSVHSVSLTPDGKRAISGSSDKTNIIWNIDNDTTFKMLSIHKDGISCIDMTPYGTMALIGLQGEPACELCNLSNSQRLNKLKGHKSIVNKVVISPNGNLVISGSEDSNVTIWDINTLQEIQNLKGHTYRVVDLAITPDGTQVVSVSDEGTCIIWDLATGISVKTIKSQGRSIFNVVITPDGKRAISRCGSNFWILWNLFSGKVINTLEWNYGPFMLSPDGKMTLFGSGPRIGQFWDLDTKNEIITHKEHTSYVGAVSITPDSKIAISGAYDKNCIVWNLSTRKKIFSLRAHGKEVNFISITPDGRRFLTGSWDLTLAVWNLKTGKDIHRLKGHANSITSVTLTPDGRRAISTSVDNTCILWDLDSGEQLTRFITNTEIISCAFSHYRIVLGCKSGEIILINTEIGKVPQERSIVSIRYIWDFELKEFLSLSADCPLCGHRFSPAASVLATIDKITKKNGLRPHQSPCLELPDEAWEDSGLLSNCPNCGAELKFNPFIAGGDN
jgi:WD40 repeat protein